MSVSTLHCCSLDSRGAEHVYINIRRDCKARYVESPPSQRFKFITRFKLVRGVCQTQVKSKRQMGTNKVFACCLTMLLPLDWNIRVTTSAAPAVYLSEGLS